MTFIVFITLIFIVQSDKTLQHIIIISKDTISGRAYIHISYCVVINAF